MTTMTTTPSDACEPAEAVLRRLAISCRILEAHGHGDKTLGHLSLRDPEGRGFWLKRSGIGLGEVRAEDDFILLDFSGKKLSGDGGKHAEWPIHAEILKEREDVNVVAHTQPFYGSIFAAVDSPLLSIAHEACYLSAHVPRYFGTSLLINTPDLGRDLAMSLGESLAVFMQNHGVTFVGRSPEHATLIGLFLEKACQQQLVLASSGLGYTLTDEDEIKEKARLLPDAWVDSYWNYYRRQLEERERSGAQAPASI